MFKNEAFETRILLFQLKNSFISTMITREQTKFTSSYSLKHRSLQTNEGQQHAKNGCARGLGGGGAEDNAATTVQTNWEVKKWAIPDLVFFIFVFLVQLTVNVQYNFLPMTGFKLRISGIGSDRSTNWVTTTAQRTEKLLFCWHWHTTSHFMFVNYDSRVIILAISLSVRLCDRNLRA